MIENNVGKGENAGYQQRYCPPPPKKKKKIIAINFDHRNQTFSW